MKPRFLFFLQQLAYKLHQMLGSKLNLYLYIKKGQHLIDYFLLFVFLNTFYQVSPSRE